MQWRCKHAFSTIERAYFLRVPWKLVIKGSSVEKSLSSFETPAGQAMSLGAKEFKRVGSCRIMARKELGCEKKISYVI
jgi:hypothetical protein